MLAVILLSLRAHFYLRQNVRVFSHAREYRKKKLRQKFVKYQASFINMDFVFKISAQEPRRMVDVTPL